MIPRIENIVQAKVGEFPQRVKGNFTNDKIQNLGLIPLMELTRENQLKAIDSGLSYLNITQHRLEVTAGIPVGTIKELRRGKLAMRSDNWQKISNILFPNESRMVPIVGHVGVGGHIFPIDDYPLEVHSGLQGNQKLQSMDALELEYVEAPPDTQGMAIVAVRVKGDSMSPAMQDGWLLYYSDRQEGNFNDLLNKLCVIKLSSGAVMVKVLRRFGSESGRYNLESYNATLMENVEIEWAAKVIFIKPV